MMVINAYLFVHEAEESHAECNKKYREYTKNLDQRPQYLKKHHHINTKYVKPATQNQK